MDEGAAIKPLVSKVLPLSQAAEAQAVLAQGSGSGGKLVLKVADE